MKKIMIKSVNYTNNRVYDYSYCTRNVYEIEFISGHTAKLIIGRIDYEPYYNEEENCYEYLISAYFIDYGNLTDEEIEYIDPNDYVRFQKSKKCSEDDDPEFDEIEEEQIISEIEEELYEEEKTTENEINIFYNMVKYVASPEEFIIQCNLSGEKILDIVKLIAEKTSCGYWLNIKNGYIEFDEEGNITDSDLEIAA